MDHPGKAAVGGTRGRWREPALLREDQICAPEYSDWKRHMRVIGKCTWDNADDMSGVVLAFSRTNAFDMSGLNNNAEDMSGVVLAFSLELH